MTDQGPETAILRYVVKPGHVTEHLELLDQVYASLAKLAPATFGWTTYRVGESNEFIEVAVGDPLPGPLPDIPEFRRFRAGLEERCESRRFDEVSVLGSYRSADLVT